MAWIGLCTKCGKDVVLTEAGGCPNGHSYEAVRDIREDTAPPASFDPPTAETTLAPELATAADSTPIGLGALTPLSAYADPDSLAPDPDSVASVPVAATVAPASESTAAPAKKPNRAMLMVLLALLNVALIGGLVFVGATAFGWFGLSGASLTPGKAGPTPAAASKPAASATSTATAKPQTASKPSPAKSASAKAVPAAPTKAAPATTAEPGSGTTALDLGKAVGSWRNSDLGAELVGLVLDPDSPAVVVRTASGSERVYPAEIRIDADGTLSIEAEPLATSPVTGNITELTSEKMVVKSVGAFGRVPDGAW